VNSLIESNKQTNKQTVRHRRTLLSALFFAMDLFVYWPEYKILIYRACKFAVPPDGLNPHLRRVHKDDHVDLCVHRGPAAVAKQLLSQPNKPLLDPKAEKLAIPARKIDAHPLLELHSGYQCNICPQILCTSEGIREHVRIEHNIVRRDPGRPTSSSPYSVQDWTKVTCQRVFASGHQSNYFAVYSPAETKARKMIEQDGQEPKGKATGSFPPVIEDLVRAEIFGQLAIHRERDQATSGIVAKEADRTEVSPWLELTRWFTYLSGHSLSDVARLGALPVGCLVADINLAFPAHMRRSRRHSVSAGLRLYHRQNDLPHRIR
jgi:hypothetical protein